jgi:hypothetical protein
MITCLKVAYEIQVFYKKIALTGLLIINCCFLQVSAQGRSNTATATMSVRIVRPIGITKSMDMNFGNLSVGASSGNVVLSPSGNRMASAGIILPSESGAVTAAAFQVTGEDSYTYTITLPSAAYTIRRASGSETMLVNNFTSTPSGAGNLVSGTQTILVGATLTVGAAQPVGEYISDSGFQVTVNYN